MQDPKATTTPGTSNWHITLKPYLFFLFVLISVSCTRRAQVVERPAAEPIDTISVSQGNEEIVFDASDPDTINGEEEPFIYPSCGDSLQGFEFTMDSCFCSEVISRNDTTFIGLGEPAYPNRTLKIQNPGESAGLYIVRYHQNRMYTFSMGPDDVFDNWLLYTSPCDTVRYDSLINGFPIKPVSDAKSKLFPAYDILDFYEVYLSYDNEEYRKLPRQKLKRAYKKDEWFRDTYFPMTNVELHRIILLIRSEKDKDYKKTIIIENPHNG